ncbi:hypothetical protein DEO72_LG8g2337 [Vigna unguiculata]|uniref:DUF4378 domain-containing protein n=1 Tax=Vigna unguiculata TaxID=3917 RepID=A0A4D6MUK4_VIGUN|nr:hypothetical protein DEO72_LG8g2337 [Vigna unguiculata]
MNDNLLTTFVQDPVSPLVYHLHKQHVYTTKMKLTRSMSFPLPDPLSKRQSFGTVGNAFSPKGKGKLCFETKTPKSANFESSRKFYLRSLSQCFNVNEAMITRDVTSSSAQDQSLNEIKHFKNLKQKIEHVIGESRKEKLRVAMDAIIDKLPQGHEISSDLKKEVFKKITDSNVSREDETCHGKCNEISGNVTNSFAKHHWNIIRRKLSLEEPLDNYFRSDDKGFNAEQSHPQSKQLKLRTEKGHSRLKMLVQRMLSLPDLNSLSFPDISSLTEPKAKVASGDATLSSDNIFHQKRKPSLNLHSKVQLQPDTPVEDLIQKHPHSVDENHQEISNIVERGSECSSEINDKASVTTDDFGHSCFKSGDTSNDQEMIEPIKENMTAIEESVDSKLITEPGNELENIIEKQEGTITDSVKVKESTENTEKVENQSKHMNYDITLSHIPMKDKADFNYVKFVLEISGLTGKECLSAWHSSEHPVDPLLYEEMENDLDFCSYGGSGQCNHHVFFDLINETLLELSGRCYCCCSIPFSSSHPMPKGCHTLYQVWTRMNKSLCLRSKTGLTIDDHVSRDLERRDGWVNPQLYAQCVSLELEDLILYDLLEEISCDLASSI